MEESLPYSMYGYFPYLVERVGLMIVYYGERAMAEYVGRLPKAGANEELEVLGVEKDADFQQVGELRALIARGTSHRMRRRTRRLSSPGLQRKACELASSLTETLG